MTQRSAERNKKLPTHCPRCGDLFLCNNRTSSGVCDNCLNEAIEKTERRLAKKYGGKR